MSRLPEAFSNKSGLTAQTSTWRSGLGWDEDDCVAITVYKGGRPDAVSKDSYDMVATYTPFAYPATDDERKQWLSWPNQAAEMKAEALFDDLNGIFKKRRTSAWTQGMALPSSSLTICDVFPRWVERSNAESEVRQLRDRPQVHLKGHTSNGTLSMAGLLMDEKTIAVGVKEDGTLTMWRWGREQTGRWKPDEV